MEKLAEFFTHLTISATRYGDPAAYVAYKLDADEVDGGLFGSDTDAWKTSREMQEQHEYLWAEGRTIEDAISNLFVECFFSFYSLIDHLEELKQKGTITVVYSIHKVTFSVQELCKMLAKHLYYIKFRSTEFSEAYYAKRTAELAELGFSVEYNAENTVVTFTTPEASTAKETHVFED